MSEQVDAVKRDDSLIIASQDLYAQTPGVEIN